MRKLMPLSIAAALSACSPNLAGLCGTNADCPGGQQCSAGRCAGGTDGGADGGPAGDGGQDAGPVAPLGGVVTLNGGFAQPAANLSWVYAWDHVPTSSEAPQLTAKTHGPGDFGFSGADAGASYSLVVQYDIDGDRDPTAGASDRFDGFLQPALAGSAAGEALTLDVQTSACVVWSEFDADVGATWLLALVADIPSVFDGTELGSSDVTQAEAEDPNAANYGLTKLSGTNDPRLEGKFVWTPSSLGSAPTPPDGSYRFTIHGTGYPAGHCRVDHHPLTAGPSGLAVSIPWVATTTNVVTWTSAPGTEGDDLTLTLVNSDGSDGAIQFEDSSALSPESLPKGKCPALTKCRVRVTSTHSATSGFQGESIASASASQVFNSN